MSFGVVRRNRERPMVVLDGFLQLTPLLDRKAEVHPYHRVVRSERERMAPTRDRLIQPAQRLEREGEIVMRRNEIRLKLQRALEFDHRFQGAPLLGDDRSQIEMDLGSVRPEREELFIGRSRLSQAAEFPKRIAQVQVRIRVVRPQLDCLLIMADRVVHAPY